MYSNNYCSQCDRVEGKRDTSRSQNSIYQCIATIIVGNCYVVKKAVFPQHHLGQLHRHCRGRAIVEVGHYALSGIGVVFLVNNK